MSDEEWACFEPFVIERGARSGRLPRDHRLVLDGVFWSARTGVAWRDLHEHFGKWSSVYRQFRR
jgi:transposase